MNLDAGTRVELAFEGCSIRGEVAFCHQFAGGSNVGVQLLRSGSTPREPRFTIQAIGSLSVLGVQRPRDLPVGLCDVSASGIEMNVDAPYQFEFASMSNLTKESFSEKSATRRKLRTLSDGDKDVSNDRTGNMIVCTGKPSEGVVGWFRPHS